MLEIDEPGADRSVGPCSRVGVTIDNKVVGQASGRRYEDNDCHDPMEEQDCNRGVKGFDGSPETTERGGDPPY